MNTKLEAVREAILKAVPEIVELKFGCVITAKNRMMQYIGKDNGQIALKLDDGALLIVDSLGDVQVLGRPITLEDVLRAIGKKTNNSWAVENRLGAFLEWGTNGDGVMAFYEPAGKDRPCWTLGLPLDQQPEPVIDFLHSLLANDTV